MKNVFDLIVIGYISYDENKTIYGIKTVPSGAAYLVALTATEKIYRFYKTPQ